MEIQADKIFIVVLFLFKLHVSNAISTPEEFLEYVREEYYKHENDSSVEDASPKDLSEEFDFIIIGAGTSGSVLANRLSEESKWKILLIEAGATESFPVDIPIMSPFLRSSKFDWDYKTEPQQHACLAFTNSSCSWPRGKALGGSSSINAMIYTRGNQMDYDAWALLGNDDWSYDKVLPYFKKSENIKIERLKGSPYHSTGGYLSIEEPSYQTDIAVSFLDAAKELGFEVEDYNGKNNLAFSIVQANLLDGGRHSISKAFLMPILTRKNLFISTNSHVNKIIIDPVSKLAIAVEFKRGQKVFNAFATREIILSAGALNSPQILMLSGVGPKDHLEEFGIPVISDLKVGENLQEHLLFFGLSVLVNTTGGLIGEQVSRPETVAEYFDNCTGPLTVPASLEALGFIQTKYAVAHQPDIELLLSPEATITDPILGFRKSMPFQNDFYDKYFKPIEDLNMFSLYVVLLSPKSRGYVKLRSTNPFDAPILNPKYLFEKEDMLKLIEGTKTALKLIETNSFQKIGSKLHSIPVPGCEDFIFGSDDYWACAIGAMTVSIHHQVGTCSMGHRSDANSVVDQTLQVIGVQGLRVVDASVMPVVPTAHTNAPALMVGEKAADMIKQSWKNLPWYCKWTPQINKRVNFNRLPSCERPLFRKSKSNEVKK